ncbi:MAG: DUF5916 domain-containing protein [Calditrichia bacterium]
MRKRDITLYNATLFLLILATHLLASDKKISTTRAIAEIKIDGVLEDKEWTMTDSARKFIQLEPDKGKNASENTVVYVTYDDHFFYVAFNCYSSRAETIVSSIQIRDNLDKSDDAVFIVLDTYLDKRSGYVFIVNPLGTQTDLRIADDGRSKDINWDTRWQAAAKIYQWGWSVEIAIPFSDISYDNNLSEWGINFGRIIRNNSETSYWSGVMNSDYRISQGGILSGLVLPPKQKTFTVTPYSTIRFEKNNIPGQDDEWHNEIGADLGYHMTSSLIMNLTFNPDFATVEGDQERINLTRWELSFPEKRLFFLEGNELYSTRLRTFYSRRVGDIDFGGKIVGKIGDYTISAIGVRSSKDTLLNQPRAVFSTFRLKKDILKSSTIGLTYAGKDWRGGHRRSLSADYVLNLGNAWKLTGQFVTSAPGEFWQSSAYFVRFARESNIYHYHIRYSDIGKNFQDNVNHTGFIRDDDMREIDSDISYRWWFDSRLFKYISLATKNNIFWNHEETLRSWDIAEYVRAYFNNNFSVDLSYNNEFKLYEKKYYNHKYEIEFGYNTDEWSSARVEFTWGKNFDRDFILIKPRVRFRLFESLAITYEYDNLHYKSDPLGNSTKINIFTADYNFTRDLWIRLLAQNNTRENRIYIYGLFGWRFQPPFGAVYFIYTSDEISPNTLPFIQRNQIAFIKLSYQLSI